MPLATEHDKGSTSSSSPELYCPQCQKQVPAKSEKCPECGGDVEIKLVSSKFIVGLVIGIVVAMVIVMMVLRVMRS